jgi:hypothetical protein
VQRDLANEFDRIVQRQREDRGRCFVGVVIEKRQAVTANERVRMVKPRELDLTDGRVGGNGRPSLGRRRQEPLHERAAPRWSLPPALPAALIEDATLSMPSDNHDDSRTSRDFLPRTEAPTRRSGARSARLNQTVAVSDLSPFYPELRSGSEQLALHQHLRFCRRAVVARVEDLDDDQAAARPLPRTDLSIGGIVKHLAWAEDRWFVGKLLGEDLPEPWKSAPLTERPDWPFESSNDDRVADIIALYEAACARSEAAVAGRALDSVAAAESFGKGPSMSAGFSST